MKAALQEDFAHMLAAATEGIEARGKAEVGDKTMVDVLRPASDAYQEAKQSGCAIWKPWQELWKWRRKTGVH